MYQFPTVPPGVSRFPFSSQSVSGLNIKMLDLKKALGGTWLSQSEEHATLDLRVHIGCRDYLKKKKEKKGSI